MTLHLALDWRMTALIIWTKSGVFWKIFATLLNPNLGVIQTQTQKKEEKEEDRGFEFVLGETNLPGFKES